MTSPMTPVQELSEHNFAILTQMKTMTRQLQLLATDLEHIPKLGIWNTIQHLSAGIHRMLETET